MKFSTIYIIVLVLFLLGVFCNSAFSKSSDYSPGAYYMPKPVLFSHHWRMLSSYNSSVEHVPIKPYLGFYRGDSQKAAAWQINEAERAGLEWFIFDVYMDENSKIVRFTESLDAFLAVSKKSGFRFATMFTNAEALLPLSAKDSLVQFRDYLKWNARILLENENYLRSGMRPVIVVWRPKLLLRAFRESGLSSSNRKSASEFQAYLKGLYKEIFGPDVSRWPVLASAHLPRTDDDVFLAKEMGIDLIIPYHAFSLRDLSKTEKLTGELDYDRYTSQVYTNNLKINSFSEKSDIDFIPAIPSGFSKVALNKSGPRLKNASGLKYEMLIRNVLSSTKNMNQAYRQNGRILVSLGAWNEWMNGHAIAPGTLGGFSGIFDRLDAVRRCFNPSGSAVYTPAPTNVEEVKTSVLDPEIFDKGLLGREHFSWIQDVERDGGSLVLRFDRKARFEIPFTCRVSGPFAFRLVGSLPDGSSGKYQFKIKVFRKGSPVWDYPEKTYIVSSSGRKNNFDVLFDFDITSGSSEEIWGVEMFIEPMNARSGQMKKHVVLLNNLVMVDRTKKSEADS